MSTPGCVSCNTALTSSDNVYVSGCGHVFHENCLLEVLASLPNCPRCCNKCILSEAQRLYMPFSNDTPDDLIQNAASQLKKIKHECYTHKRELSNIQLAHSSILRLKKYKDECKGKLPELEMLGKQKDKAEKRIKDLKEVHLTQMVLSGSPKDVDEILNLKLSPDVLATMVVLLRRKVKEVGDQKKQIRVDLRESQWENEKIISNFSELQDKVDILEARNCTLRDKIKKSRAAPDSEM